ncbi:hypothetical protein CERZMDRAFT_89288 [Cercospora zeae-maydis SCOH1-5]|uniref:Uncharacterized protein n=1 Tax=Cercospora zeae-maydis SCOH1-5 TaxID=717836 RepID=A0A6A6EXJ5_9PEZI|nr:hypothetical protein CERZMDRAFT_89288 [Cercospora zeae-maydis SCOH1-5]
MKRYLILVTIIAFANYVVAGTVYDKTASKVGNDKTASKVGNDKSCGAVVLSYADQLSSQIGLGFITVVDVKGDFGYPMSEEEHAIYKNQTKKRDNIGCLGCGRTTFVFKCIPPLVAAIAAFGLAGLAPGILASIFLTIAGLASIAISIPACYWCLKNNTCQ